MPRNYLELGSWNVICDRCGFEFKHHMLKKEWTGLMVCKSCWEPRHPQDLIQVRSESSIPWSRPEGVATFVAEVLLTEDYERIADETLVSLVEES